MCHMKRAAVRGLWILMKDKEEHRMTALFRQKGFCWDIRHHRVSQTELLFIKHFFVVSGAYSVVDHILFYLCSEADLLCRDVHIYSIHSLHSEHMLQAHIHY